MGGEQAGRFGWEQWTWDPSVFAGTAPHYRKGRTPYAPGVVPALADALDLDGRGRLLDIGCGPGSVTLLLAPLFEQVVGVDADPGMIDEAAAAARGSGPADVTWLVMRAEELPGDLGCFRVITFAQSFHWMDRPAVAAAALGMLDPDGAVVHVDLWHQLPPEARRPGPFPPVPEEAIDELRVRWLGPDRRAGQGFRNTSPSGEDEVFQAAGFAPERIVIVPDDRMLERTVDEVVAWVFSTSSTAPHLFGDQVAAFERELRSVLLDASPSGRFSVPLAENRLRIRRPR